MINLELLNIFLLLNHLKAHTQLIKQYTTTVDIFILVNRLKTHTTNDIKMAKDIHDRILCYLIPVRPLNLPPFSLFLTVHDYGGAKVFRVCKRQMVQSLK